MNPILILHGWGGGSKSWLKVKDLLEQKGFTVFSPDMPGFGSAAPPSGPWNVQNYTDWVLDFAQQNKLEKFFLLGHSFGGRISIKFAAQNYDKLKSLILVDSAGLQRSKNWSLKQRIIIEGSKIFRFLDKIPVLKIFYGFLRKATYFFSGTRDYYLIKDPAMKETFKNIIKEDLIDYLSAIKSETLIIWGEKDKLVPISVAYLLKEKITESKLEIFRDVGHNPQLECPERLVEEIIKFIK